MHVSLPMNLENTCEMAGQTNCVVILRLQFVLVIRTPSFMGVFEPLHGEYSSV